MEIPLEIPLWAQDVPGFDPAIGQPAPGLTPCLVEGARGAVIVLPGGGYAMRADHEGLPVAEMLNRAGISAFVLSYRVAPYRDPVPLLDVRTRCAWCAITARSWALSAWACWASRRAATWRAAPRCWRTAGRAIRKAPIPSSARARVRTPPCCAIRW